jgi:hypothetical protein
MMRGFPGEELAMASRVSHAATARAVAEGRALDTRRGGGSLSRALE